MKIGVVAQSTKLGKILKEGLETSGNQVELYESLREATSDVLEARFQRYALPCEILVVDLEQDSALIRRLRQFITAKELPIILLKNSNSLDLDINTLCDIRILSKPVEPARLFEAIEQEAKG